MRIATCEEPAAAGVSVKALRYYEDSGLLRPTRRSNGYRDYVAGRSREDAIVATSDLLGQGHGVSVDLFGELARDQGLADRVTEDYVDLAAALPGPPADVWLSLDLSHLAIDSDPAGAADRLAAIAAALPPDRRIQVGAEDAAAPTRLWAACSTSPAAA